MGIGGPTGILDDHARSRKTGHVWIEHILLMRILIAHNYYQQPGGEDQIFATEASLLESRGHTVLRYTAHNDSIATMSHLAMARATLWNRTTYCELLELFQHEQIDVAHFHNTFPLISPSAYYAARQAGVPVVQSLHNYRILCANAYFYRDGGVCEDCLGRFLPWPAIVHACYRGSRAASGVVASLQVVHRARRTWTDLVDMYIAALTEFARDKFIRGGLPAERIVVKPNFVYPDPELGKGLGGYALFVGRLAPEKGIDTLLAAWAHLGERIPLKIAGDGPLASHVAQAAREHGAIEWLGKQSANSVLDLMKDAQILVFPSVWYEGLPRVIVEAYAVGLPVIASNLGAMSSLIEHGRTGLHFRPGDPQDLAAQIEWVLAHPAKVVAMRQEARAEFEAKYTPEHNYQMLMGVYDRAIAYARQRRHNAETRRDDARHL
jgi:glycosyltransferase involved in cell wall biosynthesis